MNALLDAPPEELVARLREAGGRGWLLPGSGGWRASSAGLAPLASYLDGCADVDGHEAIFLATSASSNALFAAFLHDTHRGPAQGGLRRWHYETCGAVLRDGLRLSRGMTRKIALAGLWWGGGKGLIARPADSSDEDPARRRSLYLEYGRFVSSLGGCYVTAEDAGSTPSDIAAVFERSRFVSCVPTEYGGSGDPSPDTARGVLCGLEAALGSIGEGGIAGHSVAVQGAGRVGAAVIDGLVDAGAVSIRVSEGSQERVAALSARWDSAPVELRFAPPGDDSILREPCDVFAPHALGAILDERSVPDLKARVVCGSANNPLVDEERDGSALAARGVTYVPDYIVNRMGIVRCADEPFGRLPADPAVLRHLDPAYPDGIPATVTRVIEAAQREGVPPGRVAERLARERAREPHPIFGHRALAIARSVAESDWCRGGPFEA